MKYEILNVIDEYLLSNPLFCVFVCVCVWGGGGGGGVKDNFHLRLKSQESKNDFNIMMLTSFYY